MTGDDPHVLRPGLAPTPFTAEEIRRGSVPGRTLRVLVEPVGGEPTLRVNRYVECTQEGATLQRWQAALDGTPYGEPEVDEVTWLELQAHAAFPAEHTTIDPERITTPLGDLDCLRYTVLRDDTEVVFWFAVDRPGMPVRMVTRQSGEVVSTVSLIEITET
ncbi:MAG TPA: hypothetical protein VM097_11220 [Mycobacteriales bacterium]|nr:hypothetical protein [Mycobacteriales bacterium]